MSGEDVMRVLVFATVLVTACAVAAIVAAADPAAGLNLIHPALAAGSHP